VKRHLIVLVGLGLLVGCVLIPAGGSALQVAKSQPTFDPGSAIVQLAGDPLSVSARTRPAKGKKVDFDSASVRSERARLAQTRNDFKQWLRTNAPDAQVTNEFDIAVHGVGVKLNGTTLETLRSAPTVRRAELQMIYQPIAHDDPDLSLVHANEAWAQAGGAANAGAGVKVAVIDSGIDVTHPCFDDTGYPTQAQSGDPKLTNNKVIVAKVFNNQLNQNDLDATAVNAHGTHVAGTIGCNAHTPAVVDGVDIPYDPSGVAPRALLGNYNVFPGDVGSARSEDILDALDAAYSDGFDVANMSLGGARNDGGGAFLLDNAVDNLDQANMVVAIAAGNEGPGYFTVHYPGAAPRALTAGASTVGHGVVNVVEVAGTEYEAVVGDFAELESDVTAPLEVVSDPASGLPHNLNLACDDSPALPDLTGSIALLGRGTCDFTVKMRNAQNAGAVGVIMVDRIEEAPFVMSHNDLEPRPTIPGVMVRLSAGAAIDDHDGGSATLKALGVYITRPEDTNLMAGFSSWGPTHGDLLIKPDVTAPGADVLSSVPATECSPVPPEGCWAFFGGTSMATPHLAGAAAVVRGIHPTWSAAEVRSAIVNTAQQNVLRHPETNAVTNDALIVGAGLLDVGAAGQAVAGLDPVSRSFGSISTGAGRSLSRSFVITNLAIVPKTFTVTLADDASDGVLFSTNAGTVTLAPGQSASATVKMDAAKGAVDGNRQATLRVTSSGVEVAHAVVFVLVGEGDRAPGQHQLPPPKA
jgi:minor extracellular serine protease Vpr